MPLVSGDDQINTAGDRGRQYLVVHGVWRVRHLWEIMKNGSAHAEVLDNGVSLVGVDEPPETISPEDINQFADLRN